MATSYIGADVDCKYTELAVKRGNTLERYRVPTAIPPLREVLSGIAGRKELTIEEGTMAHWLYRNLKDAVDDLVVCDPRRNAYIAKDGDKDDRIDAAKLADLLAGGYLRKVYHSDDEDRVVLKQWTALYHDRVRESTRQINKIRACCRAYGVRPPRGVLRNPDIRGQWLASLGECVVAEQLVMLWLGLDSVIEQVGIARGQLRRRSRTYRIVTLWQEIPGVGLIRAVTFLAYVDTPWRFARRSKLWKYCGVGLERYGSGTDRDGRPKTGKLHLAWAVNKRLKNAVIGATISAIEQGNNPFSRMHERLVSHGLTESNARHTVARKLVTVMSSMWKTEQPFDPRLV